MELYLQQLLCQWHITSQSVTKDRLMSSDAGNHTCIATDSDGNSESAVTEMKIIG